MAPAPVASGTTWAYVGVAPNPARHVTLRTIDEARVLVVLETTGDVIEEIELCKAFFQVYDGAVYLHQARTYVCSKLDLNDMVAHVRPVRVKYFTSLIDFTDVHVIGGNVAYRQVARSG